MHPRKKTLFFIRLRKIILFNFWIYREIHKVVTRMVTVAVGRRLSSQVAVSEHRQYFCRVIKAVLFNQNHRFGMKTS
jgi:hypothetical protein